MSNRKTARSTPKLVVDRLSYREKTPIGDFWHTVVIDTDDWQRWLERGETFSYDGQYTVRCEKRRNTFYWYAFQREGKKLNKRYVGTSSAVTRQKLLEIWAAFRYGEDHPIFRTLLVPAVK